MAAPFDELQRASFFGIEFVVDKIHIKCRLRTHVHEYPHAPGGDIEKLERGLYEISIDAVFLTGIVGYEDAWPDRLQRLRELFEQGVTDDLVIPTVGTIKAVCVDWDQDMESKVRNGERAHFVFLEDAKTALIVDTPLAVSYTSTTQKYEALVIFSVEAGFDIGIFDAISSFVSQIQAYRDQIDLYGELIAMKAEQLAAACRALDETPSLFDDPGFAQIVHALHDLGVAAANLAKDALRKSTPFIYFDVPIEMPISAVSRAMYSDTSHSYELMKLNSFDDALHIPTGTVVKGYGIPAPLGTKA